MRKGTVLFLILAVVLWGCLPAPPAPAQEKPVTLDIEYVRYQERMLAEPSAQWQVATSQLFVDLRAALGVERLAEAFDVFYIFAAESEQAALLNAVKNGHTATNNGMTFTSRVGMQGDGVADYINTNYNPAVDGVQYAADDALVGLYYWDNPVSYNPFDLGCTDALARGTAVNRIPTGVNFRVNGSATSTSTDAGTGALLAMTQRIGSGDGDVEIYKDGVSDTFSGDTYHGIASADCYIGALNVAGTAIGYSLKQYGAAFIGRSLTADEHAAVFAAWDEYLGSLATVEPPTYQTFLPIVGTNAVVQIFDRTGVPIGEILPEIDFASWRRNEIGQATFSMAKSDPKADDVYLRAQNRVLITFDNGLPPWGGIMQPEFTIDHNRITVRALTGESLLSKRLTDRGRYFTQETVGGIVTALVTEANAVWPLGISLGTVWGGGGRHSPEYHFKNLLTIFKESLFQRLSDADFYAEPVIASDGRLTFVLQVVERRGSDLAGVALHQGLNVVDPTKVSYVGPLINRWTIVGDGQGWGAERPLAVAQDLASIDRYGLLEDSEIQQGVVFMETLQENADNLLAQTAWPRVLLDITAVDLPPATFEQYGIGDNLAVELPDYGVGSSFVGAATVRARAFYPKNGRLNLVLEATANA